MPEVLSDAIADIQHTLCTALNELDDAVLDAMRHNNDSLAQALQNERDQLSKIDDRLGDLRGGFNINKWNRSRSS